MCFLTFEEISLNIEIVTQIYKHLDFIDQLRLSRVTKHLKCIFETYIWKQQYTTLKLFEKTPECLVTDETDVNRVCLLCEGELQEFLTVYADNVKKLMIRNTVYDMDSFEGLIELSYGVLINDNLVDIGKFPKVESLHYQYMNVSTTHLRRVAQMLPELQELWLVNCCMESDVHEIITDIIPQMKNLRTLHLQDYPPYRIKYSSWQKLLQNPKIELLKLTANIVPDEMLTTDTAVAPHLKELYITAPFDPVKWSTSYPMFLKNFEILSILTIEIIDKVTDATLHTISQSCQQLKILNFRFTNFTSVQHVAMPPQLNELSVYFCTGLTNRNLRQILTELQLTKFYSQETIYEDTFEDFCISPLIESLNVYADFTYETNLAYEGNEHLKELTYYCPPLKDSFIANIPLTTCINLHTLDMQLCHLDLEVLQQLKSLRKLTMPHPVPLVSWSYITAVLQHPTLNELNIRQFCSTDYQYEAMHRDIPAAAVSTNVTNLVIPLDLFEVAIEFWLDLFCRNHNLRRICSKFYSYDSYAECLKNLITHKKFPKSVKTIDVLGVFIDCNKWRKDIDRNLSAFIKQMDNSRYAFDNDAYRIAVQRKR